MKHTKGEWVVEAGFPYTNYILHIEHMGLTSIPNEESLANAKLIASAPDLLEACQSVMKCNRGEHLPADVVMQLFNAISKATD